MKYGEKKEKTISTLLPILSHAKENLEILSKIWVHCLGKMVVHKKLNKNNHKEKNSFVVKN